MSVFPKRHGVWFQWAKEPMASLPIERPASIRRVTIPLLCEHQRISTAIVDDFDTVLCGQLLGQPASEDDLPLFTTVTGVVSGLQHVHHPIYGDMPVCAIDCLVTEEEEPQKEQDVSFLTIRDLIRISREAAIIDERDGEPLCRKIEAWAERPPQYIVADALEEEPYSCCAWAVLYEHGSQVLLGLQLLARLLGSRCFISFSLPYKRRQQLVKRLGDDRFLRTARGALYPHEDIAPRGASFEQIGVQACLALYRAAAFGAKQVSGVLTVAGDALSAPANVCVPFGTSLADVLALCGVQEEPYTLILGDAINGRIIESPDFPITAGITCVLALKSVPTPRERACIGCGRCADVCHKKLLPYEITRRLENMQYERLGALCPEDCDGCRACDYICPANRPLSEGVLQAADEAGVVLMDWEE
ncbi:MAG: hypothetical protein IKI63_01035 [Clostridia bacterium]|nr:hypothetical protein [Clostridia bacterium]